MKNSIFFVSPYAIILKKYIQESETNMNKLYKAIEEKIKESGYPKEISGRDVYNDICDQIEDNENGSYLLLSKFEEDVIFEYHITILLREFIRQILMLKSTGMPSLFVHFFSNVRHLSLPCPFFGYCHLFCPLFIKMI